MEAERSSHFPKTSRAASTGDSVPAAPGPGGNCISRSLRGVREKSKPSEFFPQNPQMNHVGHPFIIRTFAPIVLQDIGEVDRGGA